MSDDPVITGEVIATNNAPEVAGNDDLSLFEAQVVHQYLNNGYNAKQAYLTIKPHVTPESAQAQSSKLINQTHVQAYLSKLRDKITEGTTLTKKDLIGHTQFALKHARDTMEIPTLLKGVEVGAKLIGAYESDEDDMTKYTGLLTKIKADNVQVNININKD